MKSLTDSLMAPAWLACARAAARPCGSPPSGRSAARSACFRSGGGRWRGACRCAARGGGARRGGCGRRRRGVARRFHVAAQDAAMGRCPRRAPGPRPIARPGGASGLDGGGRRRAGTVCAARRPWRARRSRRRRSSKRRGCGSRCSGGQPARRPALRPGHALFGQRALDGGGVPPSASSTPSTVFTGTDAPAADDAAEHAGVFGVDLDDGLLGLDFGQRVADGDRVAFLLEPLADCRPRCRRPRREA